MPFGKYCRSKPLVFSFAPRFQGCRRSFVEKLDMSTSKQLAEFIEKNQSLYASFREFEPEPIDAIYNARIKVPGRMTIEEVEALLSGCQPLNELQIEKFLADSGFDTKGFPSWTVQFVSKDHECEGGYLVYRFKRVLGF